MVKEIPLTQGKVAIVDDDDFDWLNQWKWCVTKGRTGGDYAARNSSKKLGKSHLILMHRAIWEHHHGLILKGFEIDHIDGDGLGNRLVNLRTCTRSQNNANQRKTRGLSSFKGVTWNRNNRLWKAQIQYEGRQINIGHFESETEAARAYDAKARELFGEFASTNFERS